MATLNKKKVMEYLRMVQNKKCRKKNIFSSKKVLFRSSWLILLLLSFTLVLPLISATTTTLNSPADNYARTSTSVTFNCSADGGLNTISNLSLFTNHTGSWIINQTSIPTSNLPSYIENVSLDDATPNIQGAVNCMRIFALNNSKLNYWYFVTGTNPVGDCYITNGSTYTGVGYNGTISGNNCDFSTPFNLIKDNMYMLCWSATVNEKAEYDTVPYPINWTYVSFNKFYMDGFGFFNHNKNFRGVNVSNSTGAAVTNFENIFSFTTLSPNPFLWSCYSCDSLNNCAYATTNRTVLTFILGTESYNLTSYETSKESFSLNLTASSTPTGIFYYNGTSYTATVTGSTPNFLLSKTGLNTVLGNNSIIWGVTSGTNTVNSTTTYQNVLPIVFGLCNSTLNVPYINFTFKDETTLALINASIPTSTWSYWLGDGTVTKSLLFINNTENPSYAFCFSPQDKSINVDYTLSYIGGLYPQRINNPIAEIFTNTTTNRILYLLSSSDGVTDTTQVVSGAGQVVSGVDVTVSREISGIQTIVASGRTGDDGIISFWLNPDFLHNYTFVKTGYNTISVSAFPTNLGRTITLPTSTTTNSTDCSIGMSTTISPPISILLNGTVYQFIFNITSNFWVINGFGFSLKNSSGTVLNSASALSNGGSLNVSLNTAGLNNILMDYYWTTTRCSANYTKLFVVYDDTTDNDWSIKIFFDDLNKYTSQGIFGLDNFGLALIIFITMFMFVGIMSLRFGFTSPGAITALIATIVIFLDIGVGILPQLTGAVKGFASVFIFLIALGMAFRETQR